MDNSSVMYATILSGPPQALHTSGSACYTGVFLGGGFPCRPEVDSLHPARLLEAKPEPRSVRCLSIRRAASSPSPEGARRAVVCMTTRPYPCVPPPPPRSPSAPTPERLSPACPALHRSPLPTATPPAGRTE